MFRDLCSCHKNKKKKGTDDDDLPYSPKKDSTFFSFKKNNSIDKKLTSTPNQLIQVRKLSEGDHYLMDMKNNNKKSKTVWYCDSNEQTPNSTNQTMDQMNSPIISHLTTSPIEKDSNNHIDLNSNDELNGSNLNRSSSNFSTQKRSSVYDLHQKSTSELNDMNDKFSNLWSKSNEDKYFNDNNSNENVLNSELSPTNLIKNNSTNDLYGKPFQLSADPSSNSLRNNRSTNDLNSLNSNKLARPGSFTDSTDNILISDSLGLNHIDPRSNILQNEDMINLLNSNVLKLAPSYHEKNSSGNHVANEEFKTELNDCNQIVDLINIPHTTDTLKRVSSDDKISFDNSSVESMIIDKQANEIMRRSNQFEDDRSHVEHPNSILIQETLTLTLKRDKNDKKSLNEFSIENLPKQIFETSSFVKEYFYDDPVIRTSSKFMESDLSTYRLQSDPRGLCLIINNATTYQNCLRLKNGFTKEVYYFKDIFTKLGFNVEIHSNVNAGAICKLMKGLKNKIDTNDDAFVCVYFGHGNSSYVIGEDNFKLNLELMIGCMNNYHCPKLVNKPKIFIVHTCNSTCQTFLEPIAPSNIPREVQALKKLSNFKIIPTWTDTVIVYSPFVNSNQLHYSPFAKEIGLALCNDSFELSLHDILLKANNQILMKPQYKGQYGIDINYRGFNKSLFFNPGHFC